MKTLKITRFLSLFYTAGLLTLFTLLSGNGQAQTTNCTAHFAWQAAPNTNGAISFNPVMGGANMTQFRWQFGDGDSSAMRTPTHQYAQPGTYWVCLTVTQFTSVGVACTATWCDSVSVNAAGANCNAHYSWITAAGSNGSVYFNPMMNGTMNTHYSWNFGDGDTSSVRNPTHQYAQPGSYWACLTVTQTTSTGATCTDTWCDSVKINVPTVNCDAHFAQQPGSQPNSVYFNPAPNPQGTHYSWNFGDGDTSSMRTPLHVYAQPGSYFACLTVTQYGPNGGVTCTATWCDSVRIGNSQLNCTANFTWTLASSNGSTVSFRPAMMNPGVNYSWNFGDGDTSSAMTPYHQYAQPGAYWVCLTVVRTSATGAVCTDTHCDSVRINPPQPPHCNATFNFMRQFSPARTFRFRPLNMHPGATYYWSFGDGDTSSAPSPVHTYADTGVYQVCLILSMQNSAGSCSDTVCRNLYVRPMMNHGSVCRARFTFQPVPSSPATLSFTSYVNGNPTSYFWTFGDSTSSTQMNPVHQFPGPGAYNVCLTIRDSATNCFNRFCRLIWIGPNNMPLADEEETSAMRLESGSIVSPAATIYPNPVASRAVLHLEGTNGNAALRVFDTSGRLLLEKSGMADGDHDLDVSLFTKGILFYQVLEADGVIANGKLIVQ